MNLRQQINELIVLMGKGMYEREEVIALSLLSALAGEPRRRKHISSRLARSRQEHGCKET